MLLTCRKSCGNCGCEDLAANCSSLAREEKCLHDDHVNWMLRNCQRSCKVCLGNIAKIHWACGGIETFNVSRKGFSQCLLFRTVWFSINMYKLYMTLFQVPEFFSRFILKLKYWVNNLCLHCGKTDEITCVIRHKQGKIGLSLCNYSDLSLLLYISKQCFVGNTQWKFKKKFG